MSGYIKLYRTVFDNKRLFPKPYTEGVAWIWLLCFATYEDMTVEENRSGGFQVLLKRGEIAGSLSFFAEKFSWSKTSVYTFIKYLKRENMIETRIENNMTVIYILNYNKYQNLLNSNLNIKTNGQLFNYQDSYDNNLNSNLNSNLNEKYKYININKKDNNNKLLLSKNKVFVKPTVSEIAKYCKERNNNIQAEAFFDFYQSKGWMVGRNPMKDWKAAVRTWERSGYRNTNNNNLQTAGNNSKKSVTQEMADILKQQGIKL